MTRVDPAPESENQFSPVLAPNIAPTTNLIANSNSAPQVTPATKFSPLSVIGKGDASPPTFRPPQLKIFQQNVPLAPLSRLQFKNCLLRQKNLLQLPALLL